MHPSYGVTPLQSVASWGMHARTQMTTSPCPFHTQTHTSTLSTPPPHRAVTSVCVWCEKVVYATWSDWADGGDGKREELNWLWPLSQEWLAPGLGGLFLWRAGRGLQVPRCTNHFIGSHVMFDGLPGIVVGRGVIQWRVSHWRRRMVSFVGKRWIQSVHKPISEGVPNTWRGVLSIT